MKIRAKKEVFDEKGGVPTDGSSDKGRKKKGCPLFKC